MKTLVSKTKPLSALLSLLVLIVVFTITPHAFAQSPTVADDPHGPLESVAWIAAMSVAGVMSGVGVLTTIKLGKK